MRAALYARVSTKGQHNGREQTTENQLLDLRKYAESRGLEVIAELEDVGVSGSKTSRPGLDELLRLARARKVDCVVVAALDRFGRSLSHLTRSLEELQALGVGFVSLRESLDLTTPTGRLMFALVGAMAEFERSLIIERVNAGMRRAKTQGTRSGKPIGHPRVLFDRGKARELHAAGQSVRQIAAALGVSSATVHRTVRVSRNAVADPTPESTPQQENATL